MHQEVTDFEEPPESPEQRAKRPRSVPKKRCWIAPNRGNGDLCRRMTELANAALAFMPKCCETSRGRWGFHYGYIVESGTMVKIGTSADPVTRLVGLQASSAIAVTPIAIGRGEMIEKRLHLRFSGSRKHGEWFTGSTIKKWLDRKPPNVCISCFDRIDPLYGAANDEVSLQLELAPPGKRKRTP